MWGDHMNMDWWWGWGGFHMIGYVLLVIVLVVAVAWILSCGVTPGGRGATPPKSALDILKERYARGEIGKEEFEQKKHDLQA
jgi:putative membrane protein